MTDPDAFFPRVIRTCMHCQCDSAMQRAQIGIRNSISRAAVLLVIDQLGRHVVELQQRAFVPSSRKRHVTRTGAFVTGSTSCTLE